MQNDLRASFLTYYLESLGERTREEKGGTKFGFDWVVYNLALAAGWTPHRLPFIRSDGASTARTKTEPEFGVDLAFVSPDRTTLRVFVLKDEVLNNRNWTGHSFDLDLRNASSPDLSDPALSQVSVVEVILCYNKDEDHAGVELYKRLTTSLGTRAGDNARLQFDRWNLSSLVDRVQASLLSPALLPQKFFSQFSYICSQFSDFRHGSNAWSNQLVPNWRHFLSSLFSENADERCVRLLPVALVVLRAYSREGKSSETGWIDLMEWGVLAAWDVARRSKNVRVAKAVMHVWQAFYLSELERYYKLHATDFATPLSVDRPASGSLVDAVVAAANAHWHLGRLGVLSEGVAEIRFPEGDPRNAAIGELLDNVANWLAGLLTANPSAFRPLIDIHHVELVLTWAVFARVGRHQDVHHWLLMLVERLTIRRNTSNLIPFLEGHSSLELVFEHVATGERPPEFCDSSSMYLVCLLEIICSLPDETARLALLQKAYRRLVLARDDVGTRMEGREPIDLMLWIPPVDWSEKYLLQSLAGEGECALVRFDRRGEDGPESAEELEDALYEFVTESRKKREFEFTTVVPASVIALTCLKYSSPLPPEVWRCHIFEDRSEAAVDETAGP